MARKNALDPDFDENENRPAEDAATAEAEAATEAEAEVEAPIEPSTVTVENAVTEDQMRDKIRRLAKGRKNYELCGVLRASPSTISNFVKGNGGLTRKMIEGLGVEERVTYVVTDPDKFNNFSV